MGLFTLLPPEKNLRENKFATIHRTVHKNPEREKFTGNFGLNKESSSVQDTKQISEKYFYCLQDNQELHKKHDI